MKFNFTHTHGSVWLTWVAIVFFIGMIVFFLGVYPNFIIILESFGFKNTEQSQHAFFWFLVSVWVLLCLRGAKVTYEYKKSEND